MQLFFSPLEQFTTFQIFNTPIFDLFNISNITLTILLIQIFLTFLFYGILTEKQGFHLIPSTLQNIVEKLIYAIFSIVEENIQSKKKTKFVPIIASIFLFFFFINLFGTLPYSFTLTSQIVFTLIISLFLFIGIQIINIKKNKFKFFSNFFPSGISILLSFLIIPIELISFIFKPIALAIRLFANMTAGHTVLKIYAGFVWTLFNTAGIHYFFLQYFVLTGFVVLFLLEVGIAVVQAFVITVLISTYINDIYNLH
jgi:F-type H+-transporting ATPase subunit a